MPEPVYIFLCDSTTEKEVMERCLFGTTRRDWQQMNGLQRGSAALLYNYEQAVFTGPFRILEHRRGHPFDRDAFNGRFPAQARFETLDPKHHLRLDDVCNEVGWDIIRQNANETITPYYVVRGDKAEKLLNLFEFKEEETGTGVVQNRNVHRERFENIPTTAIGREPARVDATPVERTFRTKQGFNVLSKAEQIIANILADLELECFYDGNIPGVRDYRYDFWLKKYDLYIEYWGLAGQPEYDRKRDLKRREYSKHGYKLIELTPEDEPDLEDTLRRKLRAYGVKEIDASSRHGLIGFIRRLIARVSSLFGSAR